MLWGILLLALACAVVYAAWLCYRLVFYNRNMIEKDAYAIPPGEQYEKHADRILSMIHEVEQLPYEQLYITAADGVRLAARYYEFNEGAPVQILFHGYRGNSVREYCGNDHMAKELGFNSIVVDERAHGKSGGHTISFGIMERYDCLEWVRYACERFGKDTPIILSGVSMGAATVLMASELDLPKNVSAIIADCPYSSPGAIIRKVCKNMRLPSVLLYPLVVLGALFFGRFRLWESSPVKAVKKTNIPILLIHGNDDRFVPSQMSEEIFKACTGPKKLITVPGAGHGLSYMVDTPYYENSVRNFLKNCEIPIKK